MALKIKRIRTELQDVRNNLAQIIKTTNDLLIRHDLLISKVREYEDSLKTGIDEDENEKNVLEFLTIKLGTSLEELKSSSRVANSVENRNIIIFILRKQFGTSTPKLGKMFNRDHTTILHSLETVVNQMRLYRAFKCKVEKLQGETNDMLTMSERQFQDYKGIKSETIPSRQENLVT